MNLLQIRSNDLVAPIEFSLVSLDNLTSPQNARISRGVFEVERKIAEVQSCIDEYNREFERLTNNADGFDNLVAVGSGVLCGLIDAFFVGEFNFAELKADSNMHINKLVESYAKLNGYNGEGRLKGAIAFLEDKFPVAQDNIWKDSGISSTRLHHLEDIAHHPTPVGLLASIFVTFFRVGIFVDKDGTWHFKSVSTDYRQMLKIWLPIVVTGVLMWLVNQAESKHPEKFDKLPKPIQKLIHLLALSPAVMQILKVSFNWVGHLVSDVGGSKSTAGGGMGLPGVFVSLLKEISSIPPINLTPLPKIVSDLYSKEKFDLRAELAVVEHLGKQAFPVLLNEVIVRTFYFVRRLIMEKKQHEDWRDVNWHNVLPFNNRTVNRMLTISSGTFMAVDMADAAIRSGMKSGGEAATFAINFALNVNFVGIGRFALAVWSDTKMGVRKIRCERERSILLQEQMELYNARMFYKSADMWVSAAKAEKSVRETEETARQAMSYTKEAYTAISEDLSQLSDMQQQINENNPGLLDDIRNILD